MFLSTFFTVSVFILSVSVEKCRGADAGNWGYKTGQSFLSPDKWNQIPGSSCGGRRQSPIDIKPNEAQYYSALQPVRITGSPAGNVQISQDKVTVKLSFKDNWNIQFGNTGCLKPVSIHWHWGSDDTQGSEHTINGRKYPIEGHLVNFNCEIYNSSAAALSGPSGLYVIGFFYQIGDDNPTIGKITDSIGKLTAGGSLAVPDINPRDFLPNNLNRYYRYEGSLTTPMCTENVIWTVLVEPLTIGPNQLKAFRQLQFGSPESGPMVDNFRPVVVNADMADYIKRVVYISISIAKTYHSTLVTISIFVAILFTCC